MGFVMQILQIYSDNQAAIANLKNPMLSERSKHIDVQYHFVRERVELKELSFSYVSTKDMVADALTKALPEALFVRCRAGMGIK